MAYQRDDIERVRAATDLVELVEELTKVKRSGRTVMAICPFHQEKTPSMSVDAARGLYHCFGCGASGDLFKFVQETQALDFNEAVELLARRSGITLQRDPQAARRRGRRESLITAVKEAVAFYHDRLRTGADAAAARSYLRGRGYDAGVVARFQIGYAPAEGDRLIRHLRGAEIAEASILGAGLAVRSREGRLVDRFRGRILFPIFDLRGDPAGFGARLLDGTGPKYLNSPETPLYRKSRLLYGLNWAKSEIVRAGYAAVVEGYTDVIALHQAGMSLAVATCGTALGEPHLDLLRRFTERVVLMFDADAAGIGASLRGFEQSPPGDLDLRMAMLPAGQDPAELVSSGDTETLRKAIDDSQPLLQFRVERELERFDLSEPEARGRAVRVAAGLAARHPDPVTRREYAVFLARRTGADLDLVASAVEQAARAGGRARGERQETTGRLSGQEKAEREFLRLLLVNHPGAREVEVGPEVFTREDHARAYELLAPAVLALDPGEPPDLGTLVGQDDTEVGRMLRTLAFSERPLADPEELARRLQVGSLDGRIQELRRLLEGMNPEQEPETYSARFEELIGLERNRRELWSPN
ncbi:MAG: DNA primase [Acidimicrobiia bacterium]